MRHENENDSVEQRQMEEIEPADAERGDEPRSAEKDSKGQSAEPDIQAFIDILMEHQRNCEEQGKFVEAEVAKNRIAELRQQQEMKQMEDLKSRHLSMKLEVEQAHLEEFNGFNRAWDDKMKAFEERAKEDEERLESKHRQEFETSTSQILSKLPERPKPSSEILNLKTILTNLAKQKNYTEAHAIQERIQKLQKEDQERWEAERQQKLSYQQTLLMKKHAMELKAFQKKVQSRIESLKKQRALELEQLLQKYQNIKKDLDTQHALELKRVQKRPPTAASSSIYSSKISPGKSSVHKKTGPLSKGMTNMQGARGEAPASMPSGN